MYDDEKVSCILACSFQLISYRLIFFPFFSHEYQTDLGKKMCVNAYKSKNQLEKKPQQY